MKTSRSTPSHSLSRFLSSRDPHCRVFFTLNDGVNDPGGDNNPTVPPVVPPVENPGQSDKDKPDFKALTQAVVAEVLAAQSVKGDQGRALEVLAGRNARLKDDYDGKVEEIGRLKTQIPDSAQAKADAEELAGWRKLAEKGITKPEDANALISERDDFKGKDLKNQKEKTTADSCEILGLKNNALLRSLLSGVDLVIEGQVEGETDNRVVKVRTKTEKDGRVEESVVAFDDYAKSKPELQDALPVLQKDVPAPIQGARHVAQGSGGTKVQPPNPTNNYLNKKYPRPDQSSQK